MCIVAAGAGTVRCVIFVRDMHESNIQNIHDMLVVEGVKNVFALAFGSNVTVGGTSSGSPP